MRELLRRSLNFDSFRTPQAIAAAMLLAYLLQCVWLIHVQATRGLSDSDHALSVYQGLEQWRGGAIAGTPNALRSESITGLPSAGRSGHLRVRDGYDQDRSPMYYLIAAAPFVGRLESRLPQRAQPFFAASPYLFFGVMLGASLWYVTRRLYGNAGGYIALSLYCFSPAMILNVAGIQSIGEMGAVWGAFGTIFTAIAVAHTLYAPREVVLWNWRRILLLGLSLALAIGNQFSLGIFALVILPLMLWVAPVRLRAVVAIWTAAITVAIVFCFGAYFFEPKLFWQAMLHAQWVDFEPAAFGVGVSYRSSLLRIFSGSPPLMLILPAATFTYLIWKRTRYFGNTLPLLISLLVLTLTLAAPSFPGVGFHLILLVFHFVFVSGVCADLLETDQGYIVAACLYGVLSAGALWNLLQVWRA
jgi:hypothetical protein